MRINQGRTRRGFLPIMLFIAVAIILILAVIPGPNWNRKGLVNQETAAIRQIGIINTAESQYHSQFGRFAVTLAELGPPSSGQAGPNGSNLIPSELALGKKSGYVFRVQRNPLGYSVVVVPEVFGRSGRRSFYSDQTTVIRENWGADPATAISKEIR